MDPGANFALQHLKRVSRIKHRILEGYLPAWASILGSANRILRYFDCYAGPGKYESEGATVEGSPTIAVSAAAEFARKHPLHKLIIRLIEANPKQVAQLEHSLTSLHPYPPNLDVRIRPEEALPEVTRVLDSTPELPPSFFLVDPYGHPLPIPVLNRILNQLRTEMLINVMWWRISMDLSNPLMQQHVDELFGDANWREQPFVQYQGERREREFLAYFKNKLRCKFKLEFKIRMDPEDKQSGLRTKYYLLHASNNVRAVLLMKEVMWPLGDEEGTFDYAAESQQVLISSTPRVEELIEILTQRFFGREIAFDGLRERTWDLPFIEKHYREAIRTLEEEQEVVVTRISSKRTGISRQDRVRFSGKKR